MGIKGRKVIAAEATSRLILRIIHLNEDTCRSGTVILPTNQVDGARDILAIFSVMN